MSNSNIERIATALRVLRTRSDGAAFVIFEERASGKFVQFVGSTTEPLLLDLPAVAMTAAELQRAEALFGEPLPAVTSPNEASASFQGDFGNDADRAAEFTMRIFQEVYLLPANFSLDIEENE